MTNKTDTLINASDFETIKLKIDLTNTTTQAEIRDGKRCYGSGQNKQQKGEKEENLQILIAEFRDDGLSLEIPTKTCAQNHTIMIKVSTLNTNPIISFTANLKVNSVEKISNDEDLIEARFIQKNEAHWKSIQDLYSHRQNEIRNFLNVVKGFESA